MAFGRRLSFVAAQLGPKPGKQRALATVLEAADLPGDGWVVVDERTWRTGQTPHVSEAARRARAAGSITAWRSFEERGQSRWLWAQTTPASSFADADALVGDVPNRFLSNPRAEVTLVSERTLRDQEIPGARSVWCHEQTTTGKTGESIARYAAGCVGHCVFALAASSLGDMWTWEDVITIAVIQADRLRKVE